MPKKKQTDSAAQANGRTSRFFSISGVEELVSTLTTHARRVIGRTIPPSDPGRDRTKPDRDRLKKRARAKLDKLKDVITNNPVFGDKGKVRVPADNVKEPRWRPGRDPKGGGGRGQKGGKDPADLTFIEMDYDEFIEWLFQDLELPFLEKKMLASTLVETYKVRGLTDSGPEVRINWEESEIRRIERALGMLVGAPEQFPLLNSFLLEELLGSLDAIAVLASGGIETEEEAAELKVLAGTELDAALTRLGLPSLNDLNIARATFQALTTASQPLPFSQESIDSLGRVASALQAHRTKINLPADALERLVRFIAQIKLIPTAIPLLVPGEDIPAISDCGYHDDDFVKYRVEISHDPDSECVVVLNLDRSGSMGGDPLAIAKFYFLLNIMFLRTKYKSVAIVMVAHDAQAYEIEEEKDFYKVEVAGGTMFAPTYAMTLQILLERFPLKKYNRVFLHATDGFMFDDDEDVVEWWIRLLSKGSENGSCIFGGYLEIDPWGGRISSRLTWAPGGQALMTLPAPIKKHVGMARVSTMEEVLSAVSAIYTIDADA